MTRGRQTRLKYLAALPITNGVGEAAEFDDPTWPRYIRTTDIGGPRHLRDDTFASLPPEVARRAPVARGDLLMSAAGSVGKTVLYTSDVLACYAGYLVRFRARSGIDPRFVAYWTETRPFSDQIAIGKVTSTIDNFSAGKYQNLRLSVPDYSEQRAIADYLDRETARIDALMAAKRQVLATLEDRLRIKAYALTTADGDALPLRRLLRGIKTGTTPPAEELARLSGGPVPWYSPGDVGDWLELSEPSRTLQTEAIAARLVPQFPAQSTVLVGIGATAGKVAFLKHSGTGNQQMTCLMPGPRVIPRFVAWQLFARREELRATAPFTTLPILNNDFIQSVLMVVPSLARQEMAVLRLDTQALVTQALADRTGKQLTLIQEHRRALITAAVTGELDIPELAA